MKTAFLFPNKYKKIGWVLFLGAFSALLLASILEIDLDSYLEVPVFAISSDKSLLASKYFTVITNGILGESLIILTIVGGLLVGFAKTKIEDELIQSIRLQSLALATYINYGFIIFATLFIYGFDYLNIIMLNLFTTLVFFILIFHYKLAKLNKA